MPQLLWTNLAGSLCFGAAEPSTRHPLHHSLVTTEEDTSVMGFATQNGLREITGPSAEFHFSPAPSEASTQSSSAEEYARRVKAKEMPVKVEPGLLSPDFGDPRSAQDDGVSGEVEAV